MSRSEERRVGKAMRPWQSTDLWERMKNSSNNREMTLVIIEG